MKIWPDLSRESQAHKGFLFCVALKEYSGNDRMQGLSIRLRSRPIQVLAVGAGTDKGRAIWDYFVTALAARQVMLYLLHCLERISFNTIRTADGFHAVGQRDEIWPDPQPQESGPLGFRVAGRLVLLKQQKNNRAIYQCRGHFSHSPVATRRSRLDRI